METNKNFPVGDREAAEIAEWLQTQEGKKGASVISPVTLPSGMSFSTTVCSIFYPTCVCGSGGIFFVLNFCC